MTALVLLLRSLVHGLPLILLGYLPIRQQLRVERRYILPLAIGIYLIFLDLTLFELRVGYHTPGLRILCSFLFEVGVALACKALTRRSLAFCLFLIFVLKSYTDNLRLAAAAVASALMLPAGNMIYLELLFLAVTLPLLYPAMRKYLNAFLSLGLDFGWYICLIPISVFFLYRVAIQPEYLGLTAPRLPLLLAVIWPNMCFLAYFLVFKIYRTEHENDQLDHKAQTAAQVNDSKRAQAGHLTLLCEQTEYELEQMTGRLKKLQGIVRQGDRAQAEALLQTWTGQLDKLSEMRFCANQAVDGLVRQYWVRALRSGFQIQSRLDLPERLPVPELDFLVVVGNLLENALEACERQGQGRRFLKVNAAVLDHGPILLSVFNSYSGRPQAEGDGFRSSKRSGGPGLGIASVRAIAAQYDGYARFQFSDGVFEASVLLNAEVRHDG